MDVKQAGRAAISRAEIKTDLPLQIMPFSKDKDERAFT